jgi:hypothetical protein
MQTNQLPGRLGLKECRPTAPFVAKTAIPKPSRKGLQTRAVLEVTKSSNGAGPVDFRKKVDPASLESDILSKAVYEVAVPPKLIPNNIPPKQAYQAVARSVREALIEKFNVTNDYWRWDAPFCYLGIPIDPWSKPQPFFCGRFQAISERLTLNVWYYRSLYCVLWICIGPC